MKNDISQQTREVSDGFGPSHGAAVSALQVTVSGPQVLWSRTALAIGCFVVMASSLWVGHRLYSGKPIDMPKPAFFPAARERGLRGAGPMPTAAENKFKPPPVLQTTVQPVEEPSNNQALVKFFRALRRTQHKRPGAITRVCHWGDSQIVSDNITSTIRLRLQQKFGDAGHGFLMVGHPASYNHQNVWHWSKGWSFAGVAQGYKKDHWYGIAGLHAVSGRHDPVLARYKTKLTYPMGQHVSRFQVSYQQHAMGGRFQLRVDGALIRTVNTRGVEKKEVLLEHRVPDGVHSFGIKHIGYGTNRFFGVALERDVPGVIYDSLGLKGAQFHDLAKNDPAHWARQIAWRKPDLMVFGFGTNESYQEIPIRKYPPMWSALIRQVRKARPQASCLVLGPVDRVHLYKYSHPRTGPLRDAMRKVALAEGCAFWDTFAAMGGDKAALRWRRAGLMWGDLAHMNPQGGQKLGGLLAQALLERYQAWLAKEQYQEKLRQRRRRDGKKRPSSMATK
jgi:lysophospholipase L1-like esterase